MKIAQDSARREEKFFSNRSARGGARAKKKKVESLDDPTFTSGNTQLRMFYLQRPVVAGAGACL